MRVMKSAESGTYPDDVVLSYSREKRSVWAETYAVDVHVVCIVHSVINQVA